MMGMGNDSDDDRDDDGDGDGSGEHLRGSITNTLLAQDLSGSEENGWGFRWW